ncbi:peptidoglycan DD-metalloendopeptidase family protein, partial [Arthrospira platensis SPKY1]|nr:peptidoglycan DD-metalloendopeptidase family protein [Arthrospira platensis SPKY1]
KRKFRRVLLFPGAIIVAFWAYMLLPTSSDTPGESAKEARPVESLVAHPEQSSQVPSEHRDAEDHRTALITKYVVKTGDTLSAIFSDHGIDYATLTEVLSADEELLALDVLQPGDLLRFEQSAESGKLALLSLLVHPGHTIHYRRTDGDHFEFEEEIKPSRWDLDVISAPIHGSFYVTARANGLSDADIARAQRILEERVDFRRDIRAGNRFEIVLGREMVDVGATGRTRIEAIRLHLANRTPNAFLHADGNYYDDQGESLSRAFLRHPFQGSFRVSSPFNLRRAHPVTGRIAPHHGTDFAMPTGTPVLSVGDGVVTRVGNHRFAGKYIEIDHPGQFRTRYLHLSRIDVKRGQRVSRGERVALSG